jgi:adenine C2-methylase RlmN of 23S rRNA A2503 and tRNA A37
LQKVTITIYVEDSVREKDIDNMVFAGLDYTMLNYDNWDVKIEEVNNKEGLL